jgi:hypothetical protein
MARWGRTDRGGYPRCVGQLPAVAQEHQLSRILSDCPRFGQLFFERPEHAEYA